MFSFFRNNKRKASTQRGFSFLGVDIHNHLVPGIDDGSPDAAQSLLLIDGMLELGFEKFICTPHTYAEVYPNTVETITAAAAVLTDALKEAGKNVPVKAASEYLIDHTLPVLAKQKKVLPLAGDLLLAEFPFSIEPLNAEEMLFDIMVHKFTPVIAHPERYSYYTTVEKLARFKEMGCMLQLNILSISGYYGKQVQVLAQKLLKEGLYDFAATDLHHERHLKVLQRMATDPKMLEQLENYPFKNREIFYNTL
jgi:protein-tyrosine phosphatase